MKNVRKFFLGLFMSFLASSVYGQKDVVLYIKLAMEFVEKTSSEGSMEKITVNEIEQLDGVKHMVALAKSSVNANSRKIQQEESKYLKNIYKVVISENESENLMDHLKSFSNVTTVEREPEFKVLLVPNDSEISEQYYLDLIQAYDAWDITRGDTSILIAVSDDGFDLDHEDWEGSLYFNINDPVNGVDDDGNNYIDDYIGWDLADHDDDVGFPDNETNSHGSNVVGIIAAKPNNSIGIAGVAYDTKFVPIKVARSSDGVFNNAYESIIYAADLGCDVINLSWGSAGSFSEIGQSVINYAVLEKDMVVVAAAGNDDEELDFYPASFENVLSVAKSNSADGKATGASWSYHVDLMAPGVSIFTTGINDTYVSNAGSSFSAPQVAATAALVKSVFPDYNAVQIMEQIRMTSDDVYDLENNQTYLGQLGKGRLNVYRAVSESDMASIRSFDIGYKTNFIDQVYAGDTVDISLNFVNILRDIESGEVHVESESEYVTILNPDVLLGSLFDFDSVKNIEIKALISENVPAKQRLTFRMNYKDEKGYEDFEYFHIWTAPDYFEITNDSISQTVSSNANLAYRTDAFMDGTGLNYKGEQVSPSMGLLIGNHKDSLIDNMIYDLSSFERNMDFWSLLNSRPYHRADIDTYVRGSFSDAEDVSERSLIVEQEFMMWDDDEYDKFLLQEYRATNVLDYSRASMKLGLYMDFNSSLVTNDSVRWNSDDQIGYLRGEEEGELWVGISILTGQAENFHALELFDKEGGYVDLEEQISDSAKFQLMSTENLSAGNGEESHLALLITAELDTMAAFASEKVAFATVFGYSYQELIDNLEKARSKYQLFLESPSINWNQLACEGVDVDLQNEIEIEIYSDNLGTGLVKKGVELTFKGFEKDSLLYYREIINGYTSDLYGMYFQIFNPEVDMRSDPSEVYYLGDNEDNKVQFIDESLTAIEWFWDFGNGFFSSARNPETRFSENGAYEVLLSIETELGCQASAQMTFLVKERGETPSFEPVEICKGESVSIASMDSLNLRIYEKLNDHNPFYEGRVWSTPNINETITYYASSIETEDESLKVPVTIYVDSVQADFKVMPDTTDISASELIYVMDQSMSASDILWTVDGEVFGQDDEYLLSLTDSESMEISLTATSADGCSSEMNETLTLSTSTQPGINENTVKAVCEGEYVVSQPLYGDYFAFYADPELTHIIKKGTQAVLGPITSDTTFYVTNISSYRESNAVALDIDLNSFNPELQMTPEQLVIDDDAHAIFSASPTDEIDSYQWFLNEELVGLSDTLQYTFFGTGAYNLELVVESLDGCYDSLNIAYQVVNALSSDSDHSSKHVLIYPNPAIDKLYVDFNDGEIHHLHCLSMTGQYVATKYVAMSNSQYFIDISSLKGGIYYLIGMKEGEVFYSRFVKK